MSRVTVVFEDKPGGTVIQVESDPPYDTDGCSRPVPTDDELAAAVTRWSDAQVAAFMAVLEVGGLHKSFGLFIQDDPVI